MVVIRVEGKDGVQIANKDYAGVSVYDPGFAISCDALITKERDLYLMLLLAGCAPAIICDTKKGVLSLARVGRKGAHLDIVGKVIKKLRELFKVNVKDLIAAIGPAARRDSYIKRNPSQLDGPKWQGFIKKVNKKRSAVFLEDSHMEGGGEFYKIDFVGLCKRQLLESGVEKKNIFDCKIDTVRDERFFSHVREGRLSVSRQGRFACIVGLK